MPIQLIDREAFTISGYYIETSLETSVQDIARVEGQYEENLSRLNSLRQGKGHYGLMWYTENHRYCYLLGVQSSDRPTEVDDLSVRIIPSASYAVLEVPKGKSIFTAWGEFFEADLPAAGLKPDYEHGLFFEYYPEDPTAACQLWTPIKPIQP
jgi:predicted transcriptional regulator YdeE